MDYAERWYYSYKANKNKDKLKVKDYIIIDESYYLKYKDNIKLTSIKGYTGLNSSTKKKENFVIAETKTQYILIKYNGNFIAVNICEREYELYNAITLLMIHSNATQNIVNNNTNIPNIKEVISILGWKATRKAIKDLEDFEVV